MKRMFSLLTALVVSSSVFFFACPGEKGDIKIGVILPLTGGEFASLGEDCKQGIELAAEECNASAQRRVALEFEDSQGKPDVAVSAFNKLRATGVKAVIGDLFSAPTLAIAPLAEKHRLIVFSPGASNPKLTGASKYVFRNYPSDNYEGRILAEYLLEHDLTSAAVLYPTNDYGEGLKVVFIETYEAGAGRVLLIEGYDENETNFRDVLLKVKTARPAALYLPGYYGAVARIAVQAKQLGIDLPLFSNVAVEDPKIFELGANAVEGLTYTAPAVDLTSSDTAVAGFVEKFTQKYDKEPGFPAAHGYDTGRVLFAVIADRGTDPNAIRAGLLAGEFTGVTGRMKFDENGDVIKPFLLKRIAGGQFSIGDRLD